MTERTADNPYGIDPSSEYPATPYPRDVASFSENYLFEGYDPVERIGFYHHLGRLPEDPSMWRGVFNVCLPDGSLLQYKTYGHGETTFGPGSANLQFVCKEPLRRWSVHYDGVTRRTTRDANRAGFTVEDGRPIATRFEIDWIGMAPVWHMGDEMAAMTDTQAWCDVHHEQHGRFRGYLEHDGRLIPLNGTGYRDHSVGPRDTSHGRYHSWVSAQFPDSGRTVATIMVQEAVEFRLESGYVFDGTHAFDCKVLEVPEWTSGPLWGETAFVLRLAGPQGEISVAAQLLPEGFYWTIGEPSELYFGVDPGPRRLRDRLWPCLENMVRFDWDGEVGYGLLEISCRQGVD